MVLRRCSPCGIKRERTIQRDSSEGQRISTIQRYNSEGPFNRSAETDDPEDTTHSAHIKWALYSLQYGVPSPCICHLGEAQTNSIHVPSKEQFGLAAMVGQDSNCSFCVSPSCRAERTPCSARRQRSVLDKVTLCRELGSPVAMPP